MRFAAIRFNRKDITERIGELAGLFVFGFSGSRVVWVNDTKSNEGNNHINDDESDEWKDEKWGSEAENNERKSKSEEHRKHVKDRDVDDALKGTGEFISLGN